MLYKISFHPTTAGLPCTEFHFSLRPDEVQLWLDERLPYTTYVLFQRIIQLLLTTFYMYNFLIYMNDNRQC